MRFRRKAPEPVEPEPTPEPPRIEAPEGPLVVDDYLAWILDHIEELPTVEAPLAEVSGLATHEEIRADISLPSFDNSAMDGYAVAHRDVAAASADTPIHLPIKGEIAAGPTDLHELEAGTALGIMTGAPIPAGCDAVVPIEWTTTDGAEVVITQAPALGQHIRPLGDDLSAGDLLLNRGEVLNARHIGLISAAGVARVKTSARPRVAVMSTGAELIDPGTQLYSDCIYDSNSHLIAAAARAHGAQAFRASCQSDDPDRFAQELEDMLLNADVVVTTGGVSKGTRDVVKEVLKTSGTVDFREVKMQPGKPQGFGTIGPDELPIFTLPGNPVSAYVSFEVFVVPALRKMMGWARPERSLTTARLTHSITSNLGKRQFLRATLTLDAEGVRATPLGGPGSHLVGGLAKAQALIVVPEGATELPRGAQVSVMLVDGAWS